MAAGLGTRLRPFTEFSPKPLLPLMGVPMAQFALDQLAAAGVEKTVINIHLHAERAREGFGRLENHGMRIEFSDESERLLGSAGGIHKALPLLGDGPFFWVNGDVLCEVDLQALAHRHAKLRRQWGVLMTLVVFPKGPRGGEYPEILFDAGRGLVTGIGERRTGRPFFASVGVLEAEALARLPPGEPGELVPLIIRPAIEAGKVGVFLSDGQWFDVGSPELWLASHRELIEGLESGAVPAAWRRRIERSSRRVANGIWVERPSRVQSVTGWSGPAYWAGGVAPKVLGPDAVLYGDDLINRGRGIGYGGAWVSL